MINKIVTCKNATLYEGMLSRGREYRVLNIDDKKAIIKIQCDNGKLRFFPMYCFDLEGKQVPMLIQWKFDDVDELLKDLDENDELKEASLPFTLEE